ncbi:hypothetical protein [Streptomyces griseocarneus]|uniref:hypothetical protein n=1 Tax=Streptomyces griseocarneus TaxID=51201 RepID=UPI00167EE757|nr:hypothetical protein [Streptomyces griseocarneus]MBZ6473205.1 hypothetical protein [Streptomyces griseocarneus]GHG60424.1 hypothetical protein GCM10018779_27730 [Streptomyces griseocarneus]
MPKKAITQPTVTPFVVAYDDEQGGLEADLTIAYTPTPRLAYKVMQADDRDRAGVLWARVERASRKGKPIFAAMNPERQRECMYELLCQVCGEPAGRNRDGWLFLDWRMPQDPPTWPEGSLTHMPPLCERDARLAVEQCPHAGRFIPLRVKLPRLWGISGTRYQWTDSGWRRDSSIPWLKYGDERLNAVLASQLVRELRKVTVVDLDEVMTS